MLEAEQLRLRISAPQLHGVQGSGSGSRWTAGLSFAGAERTQQPVDVPNVGSTPGLVIAGHEQVQGLAPASPWAFSWRLTLALNRDGLLMQLAFDLDSAAPPDIRLEHVCLAPMELCARQACAAPTEAVADGASARSPICRAVHSWLLGGRRESKRAAEHSSFLVNGWQSFGFSGILHGAAPQPRTPLPYFSGAFHMGASLPGSVVGTDPDVLVSDLLGAFWLHGTGGVVAGFLGQERTFGGLAAHSSATPLRLLLFAEFGVASQPGTALSTDWAMVQLLPPSPHAEGSSQTGLQALQRHLATTAAHMRVPRCKPQPVGWCSWYCHGPKVSAQLMAESLEGIVSHQKGGALPLDLFQVDDGWQSCWGDWLTPHPERFPDGLRPLAAAARDAGLVPGIWLAPAALVAGSRLCEEHPDWLLRLPSGRPLTCGFTAPGHWMLGLDATNPEVIAHVRRVIRTVVQEWGFGYLKCDFLHCAAMPGARRFDPSVSRAGALARLIGAVREAAGDETYVLACGAPLGPCIGRVDAIRVSADTAESWLPKVVDVPLIRRLFERDQTNMPAARNMVRSSLARLPMHRVLWNNDPDCLILRDSVPLPEAQARATVAAFSSGSLVFSDSLDTVPDERLAILKVLLPPLPHAAHHIDFLGNDIPSLLVMDLQPGQEAAEMGQWHLLALFHWTDASDALEAELQLPARLADGLGEPASRRWHVFEFWSGTYEQSVGSVCSKVRGLQPRCCRLFAIREVRPDVPQLVGSDVHVSCGLEVGLWRSEAPPSAGRAALQLSLTTVRTVKAPRLWFFLPGAGTERPPRVVSASGAGPQPTPSEQGLHVSGDVWRLTFPTVLANDSTAFRVEW